MQLRDPASVLHRVFQGKESEPDEIIDKIERNIFHPEKEGNSEGPSPVDNSNNEPSALQHKQSVSLTFFDHGFNDGDINNIFAKTPSPWVTRTSDKQLITSKPESAETTTEEPSQQGMVIEM